MATSLLSSVVPDDWTLEILKKSIKHFYFRVLPGEKKILISCPVTADRTVVDKAIQDRTGWLQKQVHLARSRPPQPVFFYETGETHFYKGSPHHLTLKEVRGSMRCALFGEEEIVLSVKPGTTPEKRKLLLENWYRDRLIDTAGRMVNRWAPAVGVRVNEIRVRKMKTRWGSCNIKAARIWLNLDLILLPPVFLEYVLVHEMVHLLERYHNKRFYAHMDRLVPGWPDLKKNLDQTCFR